MFLGEIIMGSSIACYTAQSRPRLWKTLEDPNHPLNTAWPVFLDQSRTFQRYVPMLTELLDLSRFQFLVVERVSTDLNTCPAFSERMASFLLILVKARFEWWGSRRGETIRRLPVDYIND